MKYFKYLSLVIVIVAILLLVGERYSTENKKVVKQEKLTKADVWKVVNQWREAEGRNAYTENEELCEYADIRVNQIQKDYSHKEFMKNEKPYGMGENLARDVNNANFVLNAWLKSASHAANLRRPYKYSCIAVDNDYVVQIFSNLE